jgi:hypothetical protein
MAAAGSDGVAIAKAGGFWATAAAVNPAGGHNSSAASRAPPQRCMGWSSITELVRLGSRSAPSVGPDNPVTEQESTSKGDLSSANVVDLSQSRAQQ